MSLRLFETIDGRERSISRLKELGRCRWQGVVDFRRYVALIDLKLLSGSHLLAVAVRLKFLAGLETDRLAGGDRHFLSSAWITPYAALARFDDKDPKAAEFNAVPARQRFLHRMKQCVNGLFGFQLGDAGLLGETVDDIKFDHGRDLRFGCLIRWRLSLENSACLRVGMIVSRANDCQAWFSHSLV